MYTFVARAAVAGVFLMLGGSWLPSQAKGFEDSMAERTRACTACHGDQGRAGPDGYYPRLAGKPAGYLYNQLKNFSEGRRHYGLMSRMVDPLSDAYLQEIAQYFSELKLPYPDAARPSSRMPEATLARGRQLALQGDVARQVPACVQCHGERLTGLQPHVPGLLGLPLDYLNAQLGAWQTQQRKAKAPDCMAQIVKRLDSSDLMAVSTWLATQPLPVDTIATRQVSKQTIALDCGSAPELKVQP